MTKSQDAISVRKIDRMIHLAAILNQVSPTNLESPLQLERYFKGGSLEFCIS